MTMFPHFPGQNGISTLANVEAAYKHERETKEAIEEVIQSHSLYKLQDTMDAADEGTDENRLLPAMNRIWPFLVACIRNNNPVVRYCFLITIALTFFILPISFL